MKTEQWKLTFGALQVKNDIMSKGTRIEAVQDKPFCSRMTLEVKHSGLENTMLGGIIVEQEGVDSTAASKHHF